MVADYVVDATNTIHNLLLQTYEPNEEDLRRVFAIGCNTLRRVNAQADLLEDLQKLEFRQKEFLVEYKRICGSLDYFVRDFRRLEKEIMIKVGISEEASESLMEQATELRKAIRDLSINPHGVQGNIRQLQITMCDIAQRLHRLPANRAEKEKARKRLNKLAAGIGGIAIVGINASAIALSLGLTLPASAISGAVGGGLIGQAVLIE